MPEAIRKATEAAKRDMIFVPLRSGRTLHHDVEGRHGAGKVLLRAALPVRVSSPVVRCVQCLKRSAFRTLSPSRSVPSNPYNMVRATFDALKHQMHPKDIAAQRGIEATRPFRLAAMMWSVRKNSR